MYGVYFQIEALLSLKKCMITPNFFGFQEHLLSSASPHSLKPRKNNPVLVSTTHRKPKYLEMPRTPVQ